MLYNMCAMNIRKRLAVTTRISNHNNISDTQNGYMQFINSHCSKLLFETPKNVKNMPHECVAEEDDTVREVNNVFSGFDNKILHRPLYQPIIIIHEFRQVHTTTPSVTNHFGVLVYEIKHT